MDNFSRSYCNMKDDLLFKGIQYRWTFSSVKEELNADNLLNQILSQDVKFNSLSSKESFSELLPLLETLIGKKDQVDYKFTNMVKENPISGNCIGLDVSIMLKQLIPNNLVGGISNKKKLMFTFKKAFKFGHKDIFPLSLLCSTIKLNTIMWLRKLNNCEKSIMILKLVKWLWKITKRLVASKYYVTESQGNCSQLTYIPKKMWQSQSDAAFNDYVNSGILSLLCLADIETYCKIQAPAKLRWLPKNCGLRPIIFTRDEKSNRDIIHAKAFLQGILRKTYSGMSANKLHHHWSALVKKCQAEEIYHLYFVVVDIHDAYGSIIQEKMVQIVDERVVNLLGETVPNRKLHFEKVWMNNRSVVICQELTYSVEQSIKEMGGKKSVEILSAVINTIKNAIKLQTIKKERNTYLMEKGISQAMPLSAALCNIYLSHLDSTMLSEYSTDSDGCLLRTVDDYLYVTANKDKATRFLNLMSNGFKEYGIQINKSKTQTNLETDLVELSYFGFLINTVSWEIFVNYRDHHVPFRNIQTFTKQAPPLTVLKEKMKRVSHFRINRLTTDRSYMREESVAWNVFEVGCYMACLFKASVEMLRLHTAGEDVLLSVVLTSIHHVAARVVRLTAPTAIPKRVTKWLMLKAFVLCLSHSSQDGCIDFLLQLLMNCEVEARKNISPEKIRRLDKTMDDLAPQFRKGY